MRKVWIAVWLFVPLSAWAQQSSTDLLPYTITSASPCIEAYKDVPPLAARLGIKPISGDGYHSLVVRMCDGQQFDVIELVNAFLDKMDRASK